jgi:hypothetical protein
MAKAKLIIMRKSMAKDNERSEENQHLWQMAAAAYQT